MSRQVFKAVGSVGSAVVKGPHHRQFPRSQSNVVKDFEQLPKDSSFLFSHRSRKDRHKDAQVSLPLQSLPSDTPFSFQKVVLPLKTVENFSHHLPFSDDDHHSHR